MGNVETAGGSAAPYVARERRPIREVRMRDCRAHSLYALSSAYPAGEFPALTRALAAPLRDEASNLHASSEGLLCSLSRKDCVSASLSFRPATTAADAKPDADAGATGQFEQTTAAVGEPRAICSGRQRSSEPPSLLEESRKISKSLSLAAENSVRPPSSLAGSSFVGVREVGRPLDDSRGDLATFACGSTLARVAQTQLPLFLQRAIAAQRSRRLKHSEAGDSVEALKLLRHPLNRYVDEQDRRI